MSDTTEFTPTKGHYPHTDRPMGTKGDGSPLVLHVEYVCDVCHRPVDVEAAYSGASTVRNETDYFTRQVSRVEHVVVYRCAEHYVEVGDALVDELGWCSNRDEHVHPQFVEDDARTTGGSHDPG